MSVSEKEEIKVCFKSDFYLKPVNLSAKAGLATWHPDTDPAVHDLFSGYRTEPVFYSRIRQFDGLYQDCQVVNEEDGVYLLPGDGSKYSVVIVGVNNRINDIKVGEDDNNVSSCVICMEYVKNHVAIPCGHIITCTRCKHKMDELDDNRCPLCKVPYTQLLRVFQ